MFIQQKFKFSVLCFLVTPVLRFSYFPYYQLTVDLLLSADKITIDVSLFVKALFSFVERVFLEGFGF